VKFLLSLTADNAAFHDVNCEGEDPSDSRRFGICQCETMREELAGILRETARRIEERGLSGFFETIYDSNGNDVGRFALKPDSYKTA